MKKLIYILALLLLAACSNKPKDKKAELADLQKQQSDINAKITKLQSEVGTDSTKATEVGVVEVKSGAFTNYVQIQGKIDAQDNVTAYPQSPGTITSIYVKPGQHVSKGQVMVQLDNSVLQQQIAQSDAQVNLNQTLYNRQKNLWDQKIGTEVQFLQAQTNLQASKKALAALRQQANLYRIVSPISGTVDQMDLKLGQVAQPGTNGIRIVNADVLKVKADVPESYAGSVGTGNEVMILVPDAKDSLKTKVTFAAKAIDPTSRSFAVEIKLPVRKSLRPNMTAIIKIADYSKNNAVVIPVKAIQKSEDGDYVYVAENGIAKRKTIKVGVTYGGQSEILSGLKAGEQLVTEGAADIEDGDKVKVSQSAI
ncbi:efflux RND transporter periplasmic adaptor subunit [Mucilaginibacter phyllosphaerae]|uniref:Efflux RND transporter periplasmic adaptor subunit n=1 Tax=Mucilaginibacter phyllosphaerae TaxID=1812349 RepID=A0A4Y8AC56_9SPHI|nr:efflux RND transporter periplasmic adaptor subunit [Mucilaginibacter phyllosphaerae]MBB3969087.1 RND family efflux transporter MFP subunit [Mucilaginibacter phyllosphaerae]TEW66097.1 efflux RND transporter periplasmic adaptor subunit [Mucilaginibacter phyllosphaerae]GGH06178.1 RND transporter [Mucilaginibacter phyllosphaerae]